MDKDEAEQREDVTDPRPTGMVRWINRHQGLAFAIAATFSLLSPPPDLRPKPIIPTRHEMPDPSPPDPDRDLPFKWQGQGEPAPADPAPRGKGKLPPWHPFRSKEAQTRFLARYDTLAARWPVPFETARVPGAYGHTFVRVCGPADAPPLVLLHGISSSSLAWLANVKALARDFRVYAIDHIFDCGRSVYTRQLTTAGDHLAWLDELLTTLGLASGIHLAGLSYGGWLAAEYALRHPERVGKLVLLAPACTVQPLAPGWIARALLCAIPLRHFTDRFLRWLLPDFARAGRAGGQTFDEFVDDAFLAHRSFKPRRPVSPRVLSDPDWGRLQVPTLYLVGENEKLCSPLAAIERLRTAAPTVQTRLIAGAGHDLTWVQAERVNREIADFLRAT